MNVRTVEIIGKSEAELEKISEEFSLGLSISEMVQLRRYFTSLNRNPRDIELQAMAQAWSEHCCYKSSKIHLKRYLSGLPKKDVVLAMEDDAGVLSMGNGYVYVVKMESHNHPSAVEPYGGAATGVGGIIRDILCMGAQPVALVDSLSFGDPEGPKNGPLSQRFLASRIVAGIRDYGNRLGIPTVAGSIDFDSSYNHNPLVNAGCVGIAREDSIVRSRVSDVGDLLILAGGRTGRDGIHGVTFASRRLTADQEENRRAVQLGNPIVEEPLIHAILEMVSHHLVDAMKDLGGGGLSSSVGEMCYAGGTGAIIDLDNVILKEEDMAPWEIWISESQERMLLAVKEENLQRIREIFESWDVEFSVIGRVVEGSNLRIRYRGTEIFNLDLPFLTSGPVYSRLYLLPKTPEREEVFSPEPENYNEFLLRALASPYLASRAPVVRQYDFTVRGNTVRKPFNGLSGEQTHSDAAVIKPIEGLDIGLGITSDSNSQIVAADPYRGTLHLLGEAYRNLISSGVRPHSLVDCLNFGDPEDPVVMGQFAESLRATGEFCNFFNMPVTAGNVSLYNGSGDTQIKPSPVFMMIGLVPDVKKVNKTAFQGEHHSIFLLGNDSTSMVGSIYHKLMNVEGGTIEDADLDELRKLGDAILDVTPRGLILSIHDISQGGLVGALCEMAFGNNVGFHVELDKVAGARPSIKLFSELGNRFIVEVDPSREEEFLEHFRGLKVTRLGSTGGDRAIIEDCSVRLIDIGITELSNVWNHGLDRII